MAYMSSVDKKNKLVKDDFIFTVYFLLQLQRKYFDFRKQYLKPPKICEVTF